VTAIGKRLGATLLGGSLYELPPGEKTWPDDYEIGCEDWLVAVQGQPTLRGPNGERELAPGASPSSPRARRAATRYQPLGEARRVLRAVASRALAPSGRAHGVLG
jgi:uncharacterized cupin superfamily protein